MTDLHELKDQITSLEETIEQHENDKQAAYKIIEALAEDYYVSLYAGSELKKAMGFLSSNHKENIEEVKE